MRPRTLPLAIASISMGAFLAAANGVFNSTITALCILTTIFLQILSNLANDYGDSVHGADSVERAGPSRAVQSGAISKQEMRQAMGLFALLAMVSGLLLVWLALGTTHLIWAVLFIVLGGSAVWAAISYTAGRNPYGYAGFGDLFVFLFFGLLAVLGTYFLQAQALDWSIVLPAISCGAFATAVLNVNNIRDIDSDRKAGKFSIPVRIGGRNARIYHWGLLIGGVVAALLFVILNYIAWTQWLFVLMLPLVVRNGMVVWRLPSTSLDPMLKQTVLMTLLFVILFGLGQVIGPLA